MSNGSRTNALQSAFFLRRESHPIVHTRPLQTSFPPNQYFVVCRPYLVTNYVMLAGMAAAALALPDVMTPLKFVGSTAGALMAYIFPGAV